MKKYNITVNGKTYQVEVEEIKGNGQSQGAPAQTQSQPVQQNAPKQAAPEQKSQPSTPKSQAGAKDVTAPMPGTILEVTVEEGQEVKAGDVVLILILEAMKMENEITADTDGKITKIYTPKGTSVNTGDALVGLE